MEENEMQIIIRAVDEATAVLKNIESKLTDSQKEITKATDKAKDASNAQLESLIAVGNAANAVDNILSSYTNLQLRLENAQERVNGALDRFEDAQYEVNKLLKAGKKGTEEYTKASKELERAQRSLTVAENNQARAQNAVIGTYIQIGLQTLSLIKSMPQLIAQVRTLTTAGLAFAATPLGIALLAIGAAVAIVSSAFNEAKEKEEAFIKQQEDIALKTDIITLAQNHLNDAMWIYEQATERIGDKFEKLWKNMSEGEAQLRYDITEAHKAGNVELEKSLQERLDNEYSSAKSVYEALDNLIKIQTQNEMGVNKEVEDFWKLSHDQRVEYLKTTHKAAYIAEVQAIADEEKRIIQETEQAIRNIELTPMRQEQFLTMMQEGTAPPGMGGKGTIMSNGPSIKPEKRSWWQRLWGVETKEDPTVIASSQFNLMNSTMQTDAEKTGLALNTTLGNAIYTPGDTTGTSMYGKIDVSQTKWADMTEQVTGEGGDIDTIVDKLDDIPTDIYTYHHVITVYG